MKKIKIFDENGKFICFANFDNSNGFYDFIDSIVVDSFDEIVDLATIVE